VHGDGERGDDAELRPGSEARGDGEAVDEVVQPVPDEDQ
jgi:hypothetical protein